VTSRRVLVVGSYPPIPLPASAATVAAVRRAWAGGDEVTVVSPRLSAAHLAVPVSGVLAGHRLANLRAVTAATQVVLVMERGFPVPASGTAGSVGRLIQWPTAISLVRAFAGFDRVTLVRVGRLDIPAGVEARLVRAADEVIDEVVPRVVGSAGVTPLGPVETPLRERPRQITEPIVRRVLGRYAGPVRARVRNVLRM
jgi:hypothetical protein